MRESSGESRLITTAAISALVTLLLAVGVIPRLINDKNLDTRHENAIKDVRKVHTVEASIAPNNEQGVLPANISAIQQISLSARVDGYLKSRNVDIGDSVKAGQILGEIDTPTVDQEVDQGQADLAEAKAQHIAAQDNLKEAKAKAVAAKAQVKKASADYDYALLTATRWENMAAKGSVSLQSRDEKVRNRDAQEATLESARAQAVAADEAVKTAAAQVEVTRAAIAAATAKLGRARAKQDFKYVRAPFDGVITDRKVDAGALITAGNLSLFDMANIDNLRIYINVPQTVSRFLKPGQLTDITVSELPGQVFTGRIAKVSGALDPQTRTRQTEIRIPNKGHRLFPGMYAQVKLTVERPQTWVVIPGTTLVPQPDGMKVAIVENGKATFKTVVLGRNLGDDVEIKEGLVGGEHVIINPPVDMLDGEAVQPVNDTETTADKE